MVAWGELGWDWEMIQTINFHRFQAAFTDIGRGSQFSYEAQKALFDYLEQYEDETWKNIIRDVQKEISFGTLKRS